MMSILRIIIGLLAVVVLLTMLFEPGVAFGQTTQEIEKALLEEIQSEDLTYPSLVGGMDGEDAPSSFYSEPEMPSLSQKKGPLNPTSIPVNQLPKVSADGQVSPPQKAGGNIDQFRRVKPIETRELKNAEDKLNSKVRMLLDNAKSKNKEDKAALAPVEQPQITSEKGELNTDDLERLLEESRAEITAEESQKLQTKERAPLDVARFGILIPGNGGFAENLWEGVSRKRADQLLTAASTNGVKSLAARRLLRRALLTSALPPEGEGSENWLVARVNALHNLGLADAANILIGGSGVKGAGIVNFDGMPRAWAENGLMTGNFAEVCQFTKQHVLNTEGAFWRQAMLVCQLLQRDTAGLELSLSMANEADKSKASFLYGLIEAAQNNFEPPVRPDDVALTSLHQVIYGYFPEFITPEVIEILPDTLLRRVMRDENVSHILRIAAAEQLVNHFALPDDVLLLVQLYDAVSFEDKMVRSPGVVNHALQQPSGEFGRALLWQATKVSGLPSTRALALRALWKRAQADNLGNLPASLTPALRGIKPEPNLAWFSPYVIHAALKTGNLKVAHAWWKVLKSNRSLSRDLSAKRSDLAVAFSFLDQELDEKIIATWVADKDLQQSEVRLEVERVLALMEASDIKVPTDVWVALHEQFNDAFSMQGNGPGPMWLRLVGTSLEKQQTGEAILLLVEPLLYTEAGNMSPQGVANIVTGLRFLNLEEDATLLALEAILE